MLQSCGRSSRSLPKSVARCLHSQSHTVCRLPELQSVHPRRPQLAALLPSAACICCSAPLFSPLRLHALLLSASTNVAEQLADPNAVAARQIVDRIRSMPGAPRGRGRGFGPPFAPGRGWSGSRIPGRPDSVRDGPRDRPPPEPRARPRVAAWGLANGSGGAPQWKPPPEAEDPNQQPLDARLGSGPHTPREAPTSAPVSCHVAYATVRQCGSICLYKTELMCI